MALILLSCPKCTSIEWNQINLQEKKYLCNSCGQWINEEDMDLEIHNAIYDE